MAVDSPSMFAQVIQEHLELKRRNAALEHEMPLERYMTDDPFVNHPLFKTEEQARVEDTMDGTLSIVARSFFTTVKANTRNALIATYEFAQRNDWEFRATAIEHEHVIATSSFNFDTAYLRDLFAYGYARGRSGRAWQTTLPRSRFRSETFDSR